jgi:hypothetical protein
MSSPIPKSEERVCVELTREEADRTLRTLERYHPDRCPVPLVPTCNQCQLEDAVLDKLRAALSDSKGGQKP